ncbi:MAG: hypothetical protein FJ122_03225 [Deltaproteobacteria bacterium]|nr:hypothetical protein [Deltaproteobacteria bacterium]
MKTRAQRFLESRSFLVLTGLLYLALAGVLFYVVVAYAKSDIQTLLTKLVPKVLWVNFLLIAFGVVLCRRDIAGAFREIGGQSPYFRSSVAGPLGSGDSASPDAADKGNRGSVPLFSAALAAPGIRLLLIVLAGVLLVTLVAPQTHRIYYDEDIYANMGQNIAYTGQAGMANYGTFEYGEYFVNWLLYNKDPAGWPYLMSLVFQLFGTDETLAFYLNNLLFAGGILVVFFIARMVAGGAPFPALLAALVYALIPHNLIWANTISAENAAAVFGGLVVLCALAWLRTREPRRLFLLAALLPFACAMRPESSLIALWVFAATAMNLFAGGKGPDDASSNPIQAPIARFPHPLATRLFWAMGTVAFALILPMVWHLFAMSGESWGAEGAKFATSYVIGNLKVNGFYFFNNREFPLPFTLLALIGVAAWKWRLGPGIPRGAEALRLAAGPPVSGKPAGSLDLPDPKGPQVGFQSALLMMFWFLLFWGIFLFFYAGSYKYGADVRFALLCFMPLAVLAGVGGEVLRRTLYGSLKAAVSHPEREGAGENEEETVSGECTRLRGANRLPVAVLLVLFLLIAWLKFIPLIRTVGQEAWGARHDHMHAREFIRNIPNRSVVLTHIPTMFLLWGQSAIQTFAGLNNPDLIRDLMNRYNGHVYFHKNYWCNAVNDSNKTICDGIVQRYDLEPAAIAREQSYEYGLYRMTFKK